MFNSISPLQAANINKKRNLSERSNRSSTSPLNSKRKARVPSGSLINVSVGDIREFFTPEKTNKDGVKRKPFMCNKVKSFKQLGLSTGGSLKDLVNSCADQVQLRQHPQASNAFQTINSGKQQLTVLSNAELATPSTKVLSDVIKRSLAIKRKTTKMTANKIVSKARRTSSKKGKPGIKPINRAMPSHRIESTSEPAAASEVTDEMETQSMDQTPIPTTLPIPMVLAMFQRLEKKVDDLAKKGIDDDIQENINKEAQRSVEFVMEPIIEENVHLKAEVNRCKHQNAVLTGIVDQLSCKIKDLQMKVENVETFNAKKCVTLTNFETRQKKADKIRDVNDFFWSMFQIDIGIDDVYEIGSQDPPTLVIVLQTQEDRRILMANKNKLKNYTNAKGQKCFINDFVPSSVNARKRRERDIIEENETKEGDSKLKIEYAKGSLVIQGKPYKKQVQPPTPFEMIDIDPERLTNIMADKLGAGDEMHEAGNTFQAFTRSISTLQQVRDAYIKMKLCFPTARHIVCAYVLDTKSPTHNDFVDDDEAGAGRAILTMMRQQNLTNRVIFCNRFCGDTKLNSNRFECYVQAAKSAIMKNGFNTILKIHQKIVVIDQSDNMYGRRQKRQVGKKMNPNTGQRKASQTDSFSITRTQQDRTQNYNPVPYTFSNPNQSVWAGVDHDQLD